MKFEREIRFSRGFPQGVTSYIVSFNELLILSGYIPLVPHTGAYGCETDSILYYFLNSKIKKKWTNVKKNAISNTKSSVSEILDIFASCW